MRMRPWLSVLRSRRHMKRVKEAIHVGHRFQPVGTDDDTGQSITDYVIALPWTRYGSRSCQKQIRVRQRHLIGQT